ncbi:TetR/AcrR family transcriptional regulator [Cryptosporangium arvum]|uniref:Transcriptional regulator n=1 Tax=Cryptosporangium arvum DSM 44712 TaxID=927661 RepID=A0A010ZSI7_9ACTN|nr:TetR family transcriptional regulator [Cryptosporangium arvum]EXG80187.1 transcriptional regulator [Cryptosporangium arvum DSM 44712]
MADSREALLAAAAEEFAQFGLHGARIRAIVAKAGVNERMIYHHFGSKEGLYGAVMDDQRRAVAQAWWPALEKARTMEPVEGMRFALRASLDLAMNHPHRSALFLQEQLAGHFGTLHPTSAAQLPAPLRELYERGQQDGAFRADLPFELAYSTAIGSIFAMGATSARSFERLVPMIHLDEERAKELVIDQFVQGMTQPRP